MFLTILTQDVYFNAPTAPHIVPVEICPYCGKDARRGWHGRIDCGVYVCDFYMTDDDLMLAVMW